MSQIKKIPTKDVDQFIDIMCDAYPGMGIHTPKQKEQVRPRFEARLNDPRASLYGLYERSEMLGGILHYDYTMNLHGRKILAGGGGSLAVHLAHKKKHVAKRLCRFFFNHYRRRSAPMTVLWPFRPDFYRKMGAGAGAKGHLYRLDPTGIPRGRSCRHVRYLAEPDLPALNDCYNRWVGRTTGAIEETLGWREIRFRFAQKERWIGYVNRGDVHGYMRLDFKKGERDDFLHHHLVIKELMYESPEVLSELLTFLATQADQVDRIELITTDDDFHFALGDARLPDQPVFTSVYHPYHFSGVGIMYRVVDVDRLLGGIDRPVFDLGRLCLGMTVRDSFLRANSGRRVLYVSNGRLRLESATRKTDVEMQIDIADFTSLIIGAVRLRSLLDYGLVKLSDPAYAARLDRIFTFAAKPSCLTEF